jgi:hypothetical protein
MPGTEDDSKRERGRGAPDSGKADTPQTGPDEAEKSQPANVEVSAQPTDAVDPFHRERGSGATSLWT